MDEYKISIIIPVYNCAEYLPQLFDSLIKQTIGFDCLQIIFIDDNSGDNSVKLINEFSNKKFNVTLHRLFENSGSAGKPRNIGLTFAIAKYIMFVDADDWLADNACKSLYEAIKNSDADIVSGYHCFVDEVNDNSITFAPQYQGVESKVLNLPKDIRSAFKLRSHWANKIYKNELIRTHSITFNNSNPGEDLLFFTQYLLHCKTFEFIDEKIYFYRLRKHTNSSISHFYNHNYFSKAREYLEIMYVTLVQQYDFPCLFIDLLTDTFPTLLMNLLDTQELSEEEKILVVKSFKDIFSFSKQHDILAEYSYVSVLSDAALGENPLHALCDMKAICLFRHETLMTLQGKKWLEGQVKNHIAAIENLKNYVAQKEEVINTQQKRIAFLEAEMKKH